MVDLSSVGSSIPPHGPGTVASELPHPRLELTHALHELGYVMPRHEHLTVGQVVSENGACAYEAAAPDRDRTKHLRAGHDVRVVADHRESVLVGLIKPGLPRAPDRHT